MFHPMCEAPRAVGEMEDEDDGDGELEIGAGIIAMDGVEPQCGCLPILLLQFQCNVEKKESNPKVVLLIQVCTFSFGRRE